MSIEPDIPSPHAVTTRPEAQAPLGAIDCHAHVFAAPGAHYLNPARGYIPPEATLANYQAMLATLGIQRGVIVQPSVYGTVNDCSREAVEAMEDSGRGVAVLDQTVSDDELQRLHNAGFRGTRFNLHSGGGVDLDELEIVARRIAELGWHIQCFIDHQTLIDLLPRFKKMPVDLVFDHLGQPDPGKGVDQPAFRALLDLLGGGRAWVKISGAYRVDDSGAPWPLADKFAEALITAAPDQLVWGSDWPHPHLQTSPMPDDGDLFNRLLAWTGDKAVRQKIMVDNPTRLYDF
ncbi:MAG: amidohydrolase family protein [Rhodospirillaceae bacterium]|jgi:2-pyrone-4,6-dicarboxylate lactonase|nr:amidohydrolase family protein [Rhodospirillaceae bacterium]MBT4688082.1 amidohydrolase family protein [Rhodospirillaceae bacterium]MBT5081746.1 amidohydrolase family protein [Rhodospirillaceae bacterium]MBT5527392.1 amidohydrolase family protein [Rhodospirillaceae bacterium]MBT5880681.1 amidohydrolase family protein [Rhodospirillaceae bacterium]